MNRNLILPATIAAGVHALVLGLKFPSANDRVAAVPASDDETSPLVVDIAPEDLPPPIEVVSRSDIVEPPPPPVPHGAENPVDVSEDPWQIMRPLAPRVDGPNLRVIPPRVRTDVGAGSGGLHVFSVSELQNNPHALFRQAPQPPPGFNDPTAAVTIEFVVDRDGRVMNAQVIDSTNRRLDEVCLRAVRRWRFEPGIRNGLRVAFRVQQTFVFNPHE